MFTCSLQEKKYLKCLLLTFAASLFHLSALLFLVAPLVHFLKGIKLVAFGSLAFVGVNFITGNRLIYLASINLLSSRYENYGLEALQKTTSFSMTAFLYVVFLIFVVVSYSNSGLRDHENYPTRTFNTNISILGVAFSILGLGADNFFRISYYFIPLLFVATDECLDISFNRRSAVIMRIIICVFLIGQYLILGPGAGINNYCFFWEVV